MDRWREVETVDEPIQRETDSHISAKGDTMNITAGLTGFSRCLLTLVIGAAYGAAHAQPCGTYRVLDGFNLTSGLSSDGSVVVGDNGVYAHRWTKTGAYENLWAMGAPISVANGVSADGKVIVGATHMGHVDYRAFRWVAGQGMKDIGVIPGFTVDANAFAVSADGNVVVGGTYEANGAPHAFRWTVEEGMQDLHPGGYSSAFAASGDGSVVVGFVLGYFPGTARAARWTTAGGMQELGTFGGTVSNALGVSADGSVVVGFASLPLEKETHAFRWTESGGMQDIGTLGGKTSVAQGVSADGGTIVGWSESDHSFGIGHAFHWTQASGMQFLPSLKGFHSYGTAVASGGSAVVGTYEHVPGSWKGFLWTAEPCTCYADCNGSTTLDVFDLLCFQGEFGAGSPYADCDESGTFDIFDLICFTSEFASGCQ